MNLSELRDLIRVEAEIPGTEIIGTTLDALINQALFALTGKSPFTEMRTELPYTITTNDEHSFALPEDFQTFDQIIYAPPESSPSFCRARVLFRGDASGYQRRVYGAPTYYFRLGQNLLVYPYTDGIFVDDVFTLSYYKFVTLSADDDVFPVNSLIPVVTQMVLERIMRTSSTRQSIAAGAGAKEAFKDARSQDAGN